MKLPKNVNLYLSENTDMSYFGLFVCLFVCLFLLLFFMLTYVITCFLLYLLLLFFLLLLFLCGVFFHYIAEIQFNDP